MTHRTVPRFERESLRPFTNSMSRMHSQTKLRKSIGNSMFFSILVSFGNIILFEELFIIWRYDNIAIFLRHTIDIVMLISIQFSLVGFAICIRLFTFFKIRYVFFKCFDFLNGFQISLSSRWYAYVC